MPQRSLVPGFLAAGPPGGALPFPAFPAAAQQVVRVALRHAWRGVQAQCDPGVLEVATEPQITGVLQLVLNTMLDDESEPVPGFTSNYFETVERGPETLNYDGTHLEKRPDLRFTLQGRIPHVHDRTHYGLFVECKLVDATHPLSRYGNDGILRFVKGEYAWAMTHGLMLGYIRGTAPMLPELVAFLGAKSAVYHVTSTATDATEGEGLVRSSHKRSWQYPTTSTSPGPIELVHIWLSMN